MTLDPMAEASLRRRAERRAAAKIGFHIHALVYGLVNAGLIAVNLTTSHGYLWSMWPALGWGLGLAAHGLSVYGLGRGWRERAIAAEMERLRRE